jgi:hypothetical protein
MAFDIKKFEAATFKDRIEVVPVPRLAMFFNNKEKPEWKIRGRTGEESAIAKQAVTDNKNIDAILQAIGSKSKKELVDGIKELAGLSSEKVPDELVQRYSWLEHGSVDPVCSHELAMKLAQNFPEDFFLLTNKIIQLTGAGRLGELISSGVKK